MASKRRERRRSDVNITYKNTQNLKWFLNGGVPMPERCILVSPSTMSDSNHISNTTSHSVQGTCYHRVLRRPDGDDKIAERSSVVEKCAEELMPILFKFREASSESVAYNTFQSSVLFLTSFWSRDPTRWNLVKEQATVQHCFSMATRTVFQEYMDQALAYCVIGHHVECIAKYGTEPFTFTSEEEDRCHPVRMDYTRVWNKLSTKRGLVVFLAYTIPCCCLTNCLREGATTTTRPSCWTCGQKYEKALKCSQCEIAMYCSKDCQTKDWRAGHKVDCKRLAKMEDKVED
jgi:hypothetical protein